MFDEIDLKLIGASTASVLTHHRPNDALRFSRAPSSGLHGHLLRNHKDPIDQ